MTTENRRPIEELIAPIASALQRQAFRFTRNNEDAEDLVQKAYLRAYRRYDKFQEGTNFTAWIFRIMRNLFIDNYHRDQRMPKMVRIAELGRRSTRDRGIYESDDEIISRVHGERASKQNRALPATPEEIALERENALDKEVEKALKALPENYRACVILVDLEDHTYRETVEILKIPLGTVMSQLYRGRKSLEKAMLKYARTHGYLRGVSNLKRRSGKSQSVGAVA